MRSLGSLSLLACIGCVGQIDVDKDGVSSALQGAVALTAKAVSASEVDLSWTMSVTASSFAIKRGTSMSALSSLATSSTASFADKTVSAGTTYYYRVIATASNGVKYGSVITPVLVSSASTCGDGVCDDSETVASCPADCAANTNLGLTFAATAGTITAPFYVSNGAVLQDAEHTTVDATDGSAVYNFTVATAGGYTLNALVNAPNEGANSFYINIDAQPTDPIMIWDILVTSGFQIETVAWRGNGTPDVDQFTPEVFTLSAGTHQLIVRGREGGTQVQSFTFVAQSTTSPPDAASPSDGGVAAGPDMSCGSCGSGQICVNNACVTSVASTGGNWYVRPTAQGSNNGHDWNNAWSLSSLNWSSVQPGDTVWLAGGDYGSMISFGKSGTASLPISIRRAVSIDTVPTSAAGWSSSFDSTVNFVSSSWATSSSYVTLDGRSDYGITIDSTGLSHGNTALQFNYSNGIQLMHVEMKGPGWGPYGGNGVWFIAGSNELLSHVMIDGVIQQVSLNGTSNVVIEYSTFANCGPGTTNDHPDILYGNPSQLTYRYNTIKNVYSEAVFFDEGGSSGMYFYGNIFDVGPNGNGAALETKQGFTWGDFHIFNNTFKGWDEAVYLRGTSTAANEIYNNLFWNTEPSIESGVSVASDYNGYSRGVPSGEAHSYSSTANPFVSDSAGDFHLVSGALPINKGKPLTADGFINKDGDGYTHGADGAWDIGAYELH